MGKLIVPKNPDSLGLIYYYYPDLVSQVKIYYGVGMIHLQSSLGLICFYYPDPSELSQDILLTKNIPTNLLGQEGYHNKILTWDVPLCFKPPGGSQ